MDAKKLWVELRLLFGTELFRNVLCLGGIRFHLCRLQYCIFYDLVEANYITLKAIMLYVIEILRKINKEKPNTPHLILIGTTRQKYLNVFRQMKFESTVLYKFLFNVPWYVDIYKYTQLVYLV